MKHHEVNMLELKDGSVYVIQPTEDVKTSELADIANHFQDLQQRTNATWTGIIIPAPIHIQEMTLDSLLYMHSQIGELILRKQVEGENANIQV